MLSSPAGICAYLDLLGFSNYVKHDPDAAVALLQNYQTVLTLRDNAPTTDRALIPYRQDSFKYFIPFSDSIFFYSENASEFVQQLAHFIHACFAFTSNQYANPIDPRYPHQVAVKLVGIEQGSAVIQEHIENWYPLLFRGGIGYGDAKVIDLNAVHKGSLNRSPVVFGNAVIDAVRLEQSGVKGPRILCGQTFYDQLSDQAKRIVHPAFDKPSYFDINWTAIHYLASVDSIFSPETPEQDQWFTSQLLQNDFYNELLLPAATLWKAYNHIEGVGSHYFNFLRLIIKGVQHFFKNTKLETHVHQEIMSYLTKLDLGDKADELIR